MADPFSEEFSTAADRLSKKAIESLEEALDSKKKYRVSCPKCKASFAAPFPDFNARAKAIEILRDTGKGKPGQQKAPVEEPKTKSRKLEDLTDEELFALLEEEHGTVDSSAAEEAA